LLRKTHGFKPITINDLLKIAARLTSAFKTVFHPALVGAQQRAVVESQKSANYIWFVLNRMQGKHPLG
jgi:hypothetical protein